MLVSVATLQTLTKGCSEDMHNLPKQLDYLIRLISAVKSHKLNSLTLVVPTFLTVFRKTS